MPEDTMTMNPEDPNSFSRPDQVAVINLHLILKVDFEKQILSGNVILTAKRKVKDASFLVLDTSDLKISAVTDKATGKSLEFKLYPVVPKFGTKMEIKLPDGDNEKYSIDIAYESSAKASALQWLQPEQTAGKKHPYLFSQCQAIHCRSIVPCQDTPSAKTPYSAEITAPSQLVVLMSAVRDGSPERVDDVWSKYKFIQKVPIPTYLIAIAVGDLQSRKLGPRSHVWCEKEFVDKAHYEFLETENMLSTAENLCGEYVWGIYDLLVLPPSFPYGGMENPCLTFVTPTVLAGDRSLADVIAHEISHSWTGNLITNKNFEHFWLNEGFTMFVERKILGKMYGDEHRLFSASRGIKDLIDAIETLGKENPMTKLIVDLKEASPDDSFSVVPYEKGHTFLFYLEQLTYKKEEPERFNYFLKEYLQKFKYQSIDTEDFKKYFCEFFKGSNLNIDWNTWLYSPGMPPEIPNYSTVLEKNCEDLELKWINWSADGHCPFAKKDLDSFSSLQIIEFLSRLLMRDPLSENKLVKMEETYGFDNVQNCEIHFRWLRLCIKGHWAKQIPLALKFVTEQGRMKYVRPIYRDLYAWEEARPRIIETYKKTKKNLMYVCAYSLAKDLKIDFEE